MELTYAIIGTGGIGGYYGGKLANSGRDLHFLLNSDYKFVRENGLKVESVKGDFHILNPNIYASGENMPKADVILISLKTTNNHLIKELIKPVLKDDSIIILIQNGLGLEEKLNEELPDCQIAGGLAFICSEKVGAGHIKHMDYGKLILASFNVKDQQKLNQICSDFQDAGVPAEISNDLYSSRWQKLVWNIPFNGLTVVLNTTTKDLITNSTSRKLVREMMMEVILAGKHCGANISEQFADQMIELTENMKPYAPSMKVDFDNNRPMEIDAIYSTPIKISKAKAFNMSKVEMLEQQLLFISHK